MLACRASDLLGRDDAVSSRARELHLEAAAPEEACDVEDGVVLDGGQHNPAARAVTAPGALGHAEHGEVVGLRAAGGEEHLAGPEAAVEAAGKRGAGPIELAGSFAPKGVQGVWIGNGAGKLVVGEPCVTRLGPEGRRSGIVEIDVVHAP